MKEQHDTTLREYQEKVIQSMNSHFNESDKENGVLVIPTGGGKTTTAAYFLWQQFKNGNL